MSARETPLAPDPRMAPTRTLASAFDEETEVVRRGRAPVDDDGDDQTLRGRMIPESAEAPVAAQGPTTLLPAAAPPRRSAAVLWLAGAGAVLGVAAALAARAL